MRTAIAPLALLAAILAGGPALAHEGGSHSRGTVQELTGERIVLQTTEGKQVTLPLAPGAHILRGDRAIPPSDVHAGERAVVHAASREGRLEATEVRVADAAGR